MYRGALFLACFGGSDRARQSVADTAQTDRNKFFSLTKRRVAPEPCATRRHDTGTRFAQHPLDKTYLMLNKLVSWLIAIFLNPSDLSALPPRPETTSAILPYFWPPKPARRCATSARQSAVPASSTTAAGSRSTRRLMLAGHDLGDGACSARSTSAASSADALRRSAVATALTNSQRLTGSLTLTNGSMPHVWHGCACIRRAFRAWQACTIDACILREWWLCCLHRRTTGGCDRQAGRGTRCPGAPLV